MTTPPPAVPNPATIDTRTAAAASETYGPVHGELDFALSTVARALPLDGVAANTRRLIFIEASRLPDSGFGG